MRILQFSDAHIGVESYGRTDPETGLSTRLADFLSTLDEVVSFALDDGVDLVLFCGDAYKSRDPTQTHQREFARRIARLSSEGIPVFLLSGNHDVPHTLSRATALEIFHTLEVRNVYTGDTLNTYRIPTADGPVQIVALPWIRRSTYLARDDTRGLSPEEVNKAIENSITDAISTRAEALDEAIPALLAGHVSVSQATTSSEQSMMLGREHVLLKSSVALHQFDYVALGHIHRHQILGRDPLVVYSGSLQRIDFGEEGDDKGFCVIDIDPGKPRGQRVRDFEFRAVDARSFLTISVDVPRGDTDPTDTVVRSILSKHIDGAIVRVLIKIPADLEGHLRDGEIREALDGAHFVASIARETVEQARARLGPDSSQGLEPREALKRYLESRNVPADRAEVLMRHAEGLMDDEAANQGRSGD
jgi:exonuclease SbcD